MAYKNRAIQIGGNIREINNISVRAIAYDKDGDLLLASGETIPTGSGYAKGCLFYKADAVANAKAVYENRGTDTSASFQLVGDVDPFIEKMTQTALVGTATVTAAQLLTKVLDGTPTAAATYTLPTAALLVADMTNPETGDSFLFVVNNKSAGANTITVAAGTGGTSNGTLTVAQNIVRSFLVIVTNATSGSEAYSVYGIV